MISPLASPSGAATTGFEPARGQTAGASPLRPSSAEATPATGRGGAGASGPSESPEAKREIERLRETDRKVRAHELAHIAAGGGVVTGAASYEYVRGPDGKLYAVGGEVPIDASPENTPEATLAKAEAIRRAALAPADPSGTDRQVAAQAAAMAAEARAQIAEQAASQDASPAGAAAGAAYRRVQDTSGMPDLGGFIDQRA